MTITRLSTFVTGRSFAIALALGLLAGQGLLSPPPLRAESVAPFDRLAGHWSGSGDIQLATGAKEPIRCRASYDVLSEQSNLQFNIRCASDSYKFDLRGSASYTSGTVKGSWSESTRNASGTMSGTATADRVEMVAKGAAFSATFTLQTKGPTQSVTIESRNPQSGVRGASITLRRS